MNSLGSSSEKDLADGLIITLFEDDGPVNIYNSSPLSEDEAFSHSIKSLTAIGYDVPIEPNEIHSYGPMPTPREKYQSYGFVFVVKAIETSDPRIARYGRIVVFWIITKSRSAIRYIGVIKRMIKRILLLYSIKTDQDLKKEEITKKIDDRLQIIETGIELYYITEEGNIDSFAHISMIPSFAPILYLDRPNKQIKVLLRARKTPPSQKVELLQQMNEYKKSLTKGSMYKVEMVTDSFAVQTLLSRSGIGPQQDNGMSLRFRAFDSDISFEDLDYFFVSHITPRKQRLIGQILRSIQEKEQLDLNELSIESGISIELIEEIIISVINSGLIKKARIENRTLHFEK